jgi:hypothetical protein
MAVATIGDGTGTVLAAIVAANVAVLGWLGKTIVAGLVWDIGRRTRELELIVALRSEIEACIPMLELYASRSTADDINREIAARPNYRIFIPVDREYFVFDTVRSDLSRLPETTINPIVKFYDAIGSLDTLLAAFQESRFESFPAYRKIAYVNYMSSVAGSIASDARTAMSAIDEAKPLIRRWFRILAGLIAAIVAVVVSTILAAVWGGLIYLGIL